MMMPKDYDAIAKVLSVSRPDWWDPEINGRYDAWLDVRDSFIAFFRPFPGFNEELFRDIAAA